MNHDQLRAAVIAKLRASNWLASLASTDMVICQGIKAVTGKTRPRAMNQFAYMKAFVGPDVETEPEIDPFVPQKAVARTWRYRDPARVYERIQAQEQARVARAKDTSEEKALGGLKRPFEGGENADVQR